MKTPQNIAFFFIIGRPRSGTYLLRSLFDAHPNVVIPTECPMIANLFPKWGKRRQWTEKNLIRFYRDVLYHKEFHKWDVDKKALKENLLKYQGNTTFQTLIKVVYLHAQSEFPKKEIALIGDKNPVYSTNTHKIMRAFPDAKFIHLTRDYRDNLASIKKVDFEAPYVPLIAYRWKHSARLIHQLKQKNPESFYTLKYEDLVSEPEKEMQQLCRFLEIHYHPDVFDFWKYRDASFKKHPDKEVSTYHQSLGSPINKNKIGVWKENLPEKEIHMADSVVGGFAEASGYERKYKKTSLALKIKALPGILYGKASYAFAHFLDLLPFRLRVKFKEAGSVLAFVYNKLFG